MSSAEWKAWDALEHGPSPFLRAAFLQALTDSGSIGGQSGWIPVYFLVEEHSEQPPILLGGAAGFVKTDSYGEYIFDWAWASAARRARIPYYPKLVFAAPVTPATGNRVLLAPGANAELVTRGILAAAEKVASAADCSSIHWLFCTRDESERLGDLGFARRPTFQYHWQNRDYQTFDDFLAALTSRKRKQIRKERRRALEAIDELLFIPGGELDEETLDELDGFYRDNVAAHGGFDYLRPGFFHAVVQNDPSLLLYARAIKNGAGVGGAIFFETESALYGRYWGCDEQIEFLHFEVAYYAGIQRCIERGTPLFEAGAQGTHKLLRGFEPNRTYSCHAIRHPDLDRAVRAFCEQEALTIAEDMAHQAGFGPYKKGE